MEREQIICYKNMNRPIIAGKGGRRETPGRICDMHFHKELEFLLIKEGAFSCCTDKTRVVAHDGDIIFVNSNTPHSTELLQATDSALIQFRNPARYDSAYKYLIQLNKSFDRPVWLFKNGEQDTEELKFYLTKMMDETDNTDTAYDYYMIANIYSITALLMKKGLIADEKKMINRDQIKKILPVLLYTNDNYKENITLDTLERLTNFNKQYFCRVFKNATGSTYINYINYVRICHAENLLKTDKSILDIALETGFSSLSYFNRVFKKYKNYAPSAYRKILNNTGDALIGNTMI